MQIVLASNNAHKVQELTAMLSHLPIQLISQKQWNVPSLEETGLTFIENAILKARHACQLTKLPVIADDSGLAVDVLGGKPGIHSARYANAQLGSKEYCQRLLKDLASFPLEKRTARYHSVLVFLRHAEDSAPLIGQGTWEGIIIDEMRGTNGFGYDPVFYLPSRQLTVAELSPEEKNRLSHRHQALKDLLSQWTLEN